MKIISNNHLILFDFKYILSKNIIKFNQFLECYYVLVNNLKEYKYIDKI